MSVARVGVVGAGVIGLGVAQSAAQAGLSVVLVDVDAQAVQQAPGVLARHLRHTSLFEPQLRNADHDAILARICPTTDYDALSEVDFVIENATERWAVKRTIYPLLDHVCPRDCILAANTSAIAIARFAALTERPAQVLGMHFMNPVPQKKAVEVVRAAATSEATLQSAKDLLAVMGKEAIVVNDQAGFVANRVLMLAINEAIGVVQDRVATPAEVDRIFTGCLAHKMGPLATADLVGLDTILLTLEVLRESYPGDKYAPYPLLEKMVAEGSLGRKSGSGFFEYG